MILIKWILINVYVNNSYLLKRKVRIFWDISIFNIELG